MRFGVFFGGFHHSTPDLGESPYSPVLEAARFADRNAFAFVSTPERHFSRFGGLFPNPALTAAALAAATSSIQIRAGSILAPLHDPLRIVEDWSVVDVMSGGRVGLAFEPGRNLNDFALAPDTYTNRRALTYRQIAQVRELWRSRTAHRPNGVGAQVDLGVFPEPVSAELPVWVAVFREPQAFVEAGRIGANVLAHLDSQDPRDLADQVTRYREARAAAGFAADGVVTVAQPAFVSDDPADLRAAAADLARHLGRVPAPSEDAAVRLAAAGGPAAGAAPGAGAPGGGAAVHSGWRQDEGHGLVGPVAECRRWVRQLEQAGVDELACVVDFVADPDLVRRGLPGLATLRQLCGTPGQAEAARISLDRFMGWG
jgi:natural product biosynthesis luciferase-like monooxygenase protein